MEAIIKSYLEQCVQTDSCLKEKYEEDRIKNCLSFIQKKAKEFLNNANGWIEDSIVYKWAIDYFLDVNEKEKEEEKEREKERLLKAEEWKNNIENIPSVQSKPKTIYTDESSLFFGMEE